MRLRLFLLCCVFIGAFGMNFPAVAQDELPLIEWTACPFDVPAGETEGETLDCGTLVTYEDHFSDTDEALVELAFVVLYSNNEANPDPVLYLEGGPGGSALSGVEEWAQSSVRTDNDLILLDQRGTGYSLPSLNCIEIEEDESSDGFAAEQACYDRFVDEGINLNAYNSAQSAADVADLMTLLQEDEELAYSDFNLLGISYGTRLALTILRDYPEGVRSVIIDSVYPPNANAYEQQANNQYRGLRALFDGCAADPDCDNAYPDLEAVFYDTYESLNGSPAAYEAEDPNTGEVYDDELTGDSFMNLLVDALYSTSAIPELPLVIYEVSEGNYGIVTLIDSGDITDGNYSRSAAPRQDGDISDSEGAYNAVECREELPFNSYDAAVAASVEIPDPIHDGLLAGVEQLFAVCDLYGLEPADDVETEAVYSDVPTLVLAGAYDPITPPSDAQLAVETLRNSYYFEFPAHGHGITDADECAQIVIAQFLDDPTTEPDASCIDEYDGPAFVIR